MKPDSYKLKEQIGIVLQNVAVFDELTVQENIDYFCGLYIRDRILFLLCGSTATVGSSIMISLGLWAIPQAMFNLRKRPPESFFGYILRKSSRPVNSMDEPTVAVDPQSRNKILEGIQTLNHQGSTIIYTSHYMEEVEQICTRIAIMDHGRVIAQGTKEELKQMIKTGETITVEAIALEEKNLQDIRTLDHVFDVQYEKQVLVVRCTDARHNLIRLLNYLQSQDISFGRVFSELPTLNDVFQEITGKQLRD